MLIDRKIILSLLGKNSIKEFRETMTLKVQNKVNNAMILLFSQWNKWTYKNNDKDKDKGEATTLSEKL